MDNNVPPPPDFESNQDVTHDIDADDIRSNAPKVAAAPGRIISVLVIFLLLMGVAAYAIFSKKEVAVVKDDGSSRAVSQESAAQVLPPPPPPTPLPTIRPMMPMQQGGTPFAGMSPNGSIKPMASVNVTPDTPAAPAAPALPAMLPNGQPSPEAPASNGSSTPQVGAPPLPVPVAPKPSGFNSNRSARLKTGMIVFGGKGGGGKAANQAQKSSAEALAASDQNIAFSMNSIAASGAAAVTAQRIKNLSSTIAQGKLIHAVMETAVITQLPSQLRAVVSHDIYAESGKARLIPKGSRLIGSYNTALAKGQARVYIIWTRVIRPDGIDIMVGSPAVDALGRGGIQGNLDSRYMETFGSAILTSIVGIGIASVAENTLDVGSTTSTTSAQGDTTSNSSPTATATNEGVTNMTDAAKNITEQMINTRPVITIDQGTPVNVMVNRDLIFPVGLTSNFGAVE